MLGASLDEAVRKAQVNLLIAVYSWLNRREAFERRGFRSLFAYSYFFYKRHFEDPFAQLVTRYPALFARGHVLDVGANIGYTSVTFARALKVGHRVFAFEPEPKNFERLSENLARFGVRDRVVAKCAAVGASDGSVDLWVNERHHGDHRTVTGTFRNSIPVGDAIRSVSMVSIDSFVESKGIANDVGFIKVDVQGYETEVCRGMERTLANNPRAVVAIEYDPSSMEALGFSGQALIDFFLERSFNLYVLGNRGRLQMLAADQIQVGADEWINLLCSREQL